MLYTSNNLPSKILAKNLAVLEVTRANYYTAGEWAQYILSCDSSFTDGATLVFTFNTVVVSMECSSSNTSKPTYLPVYAGNNSATAANIAAALKQIAILDDLFFIEKIPSSSSSDGFIFIKAKKPGTHANITAGGTLAAKLSATSTGVDEAPLANYLLNLEVKALVANRWENIYAATASPLPGIETKSATMRFYDLPGVVRPYLYYKPLTNVYKACIENSLMARVQMYMWEQYGGEAYHKKALTQSDMAVLMAGVNIGSTDAQVRFAQWHYESGKHKFLTNHPRTKYISRTQPEFLSFFCRANIDSLQVKLYFNNGTTQTITLGAAALFLSGDILNNIVRVPSGFQNLKLNTYEVGKQVVKYDVELIAGGSSVSEVFTYVIDDRFFSEEIYFLFYNSLGGIDTLRATGYSTYSIEASLEENEVAATLDTTIAVGIIGANGKAVKDKWLVDMGWNEAAEQLFLNELLLSDNVYKLKQLAENEKGISVFEKIIVRSKKLELVDTEKYIYKAEIDTASATEQIALGSAVPEYDLVDTDFEICFEIYNPEDEAESFAITTNGNTKRLRGNGLLVFANDTGTNTVTVPAGSRVAYVFKANGLSTFTLHSNTYYLEVSYSKLTGNLYAWHTEAFAKADVDFLLQRLRNLSTIGAFTFQGGLFGKDVDALLLECAALRSAYSELTSANIAGSNASPTTAGTAVKSWLNANGVTTTTN